jgi:putative oxidoreductase
MTQLRSSHRSSGGDFMSKWQAWFQDISLLMLRLGFGLSMAIGHGFGKLTQFWGSSGPVEWADPLGMGPGISLFLASSAEGVCALLVALGLATRSAALGPLSVMSIALVIVHAEDPWAKKELAALYLIGFAAIAVAGAGRISLDHLLCRKKLK